MKRLAWYLPLAVALVGLIGGCAPKAEDDMGTDMTTTETTATGADVDVNTNPNPEPNVDVEVGKDAADPGEPGETPSNTGVDVETGKDAVDPGEQEKTDTTSGGG